jgi:HK97 family phage major capsid protein
MSQSRLREIAEKLNQLNEQAQTFRTTIANAKSTPEQRKEAKTAFTKIMDEVDVLTAEREEIRADNAREARALALDAEMRGTTRPPQGPIGGSNLPAAIVAYDRALRVHGVSVTKRGAELIFKNHALEHVSADVRQTVEDLNFRYFEAFRHYSIAFQMGDTNRCSPEDRAIIFGQDPEFRGFLLGSNMEFSDREKRDMGIGTLSLGGYFVPKGFVYDVEEALKYYGPMLQVAEIMDTSTGQPLPYPTDNDTTVSGEIVGEGQQVSEKDVSIGQVLFGAFKFSTKMIKLSLELLQDSAFPMESYLKKKMAIRLGRAYNTYFTVGTGTNQPNGIVTAVVAACGSPSATPGQSYGTPLIASGSSTNTGGSETGGTSIGSKDLDNLEHTVDPLYRRGAAYMMHDQTLRVIKVLLDKYGRPLWKPGVATGDPDRINNYPYHINNDMTQTPGTAGSGNNTVLFGEMNKYVIRRVKELGILTLRERFADYGQLAYIGFSRADGQLLDAGTHPICYLQQASS